MSVKVLISSITLISFTFLFSVFLTNLNRLYWVLIYLSYTRYLITAIWTAYYIQLQFAITVSISPAYLFKHTWNLYSYWLFGNLLSLQTKSWGTRLNFLKVTNSWQMYTQCICCVCLVTNQSLMNMQPRTTRSNK